MLRAGITGGIGSGKSIVASIFKLYGIPVYNSDVRAKEIMLNNDEVRVRIKSLFGKSAYLDDGNLNRSHIAQMAFGNEAMLERLNAIVHPAVAQDFEQWCDRHKSHDYTIKEAALIFEAGINKELDYVILVTAPTNLRIRRVMQRDNTDEQSVRSRIDNQWPDRDKALLSDYVIVNDGQHSLLRQVKEVHNFLSNHAGNRVK